MCTKWRSWVRANSHTIRSTLSERICASRTTVATRSSAATFGPAEVRGCRASCTATATRRAGSRPSTRWRCSSRGTSPSSASTSRAPACRRASTSPWATTSSEISGPSSSISAAWTQSARSLSGAGLWVPQPLCSAQPRTRIWLPASWTRRSPACSRSPRSWCTATGSACRGSCCTRSSAWSRRRCRSGRASGSRSCCRSRGRRRPGPRRSSRRPPTTSSCCRTTPRTCTTRGAVRSGG
mmetsp:Transcript_113039/g.314620  ORF Transcript_113039/g.314620 Transcript_113039/m.314620 type:complete len:239 (-) Transcript_113039:588-1304(-)